MYSDGKKEGCPMTVRAESVAPFSYESFRADFAEAARNTGFEIWGLFAANSPTSSRPPARAFRQWLLLEFGWSERTAQNYMRVAELFGEKRQHVTDLPLRIVSAAFAIVPPP